MTLIVGIKAREGVVLGADGAATLGNVSSSTIRQPVKKLNIVGSSAAVGVSGYVGLGQRIIAEIEDLWQSKELRSKNSSEAMSLLRKRLWEHIGVELQVAGVAQQALGRSALDSAIAHTVVALPCKGKVCLFQFDPQGAPEEATEDLPFIAVGSGQAIADPFLAFLRHIFWSNRLPSLSEGVFATLWTLQHAIQTSPGGVSEPIQIVVVKRGKKSEIEARELGSEELEDHSVAIAHLEDNLRRRFAQPVGAKATQPPDPPE